MAVTEVTIIIHLEQIALAENQLEVALEALPREVIVVHQLELILVHHVVTVKVIRVEVALEALLLNQAVVLQEVAIVEVVLQEVAIVEVVLQEVIQVDVLLEEVIAEEDHQAEAVVVDVLRAVAQGEEVLLAEEDKNKISTLNLSAYFQ